MFIHLHRYVFLSGIVFIYLMVFFNVYHVDVLLLNSFNLFCLKTSLFCFLFKKIFSLGMTFYFDKFLIFFQKFKDVVASLYSHLYYFQWELFCHSTICSSLQKYVISLWIFFKIPLFSPLFLKILITMSFGCSLIHVSWTRGLLRDLWV